MPVAAANYVTRAKHPRSLNREDGPKRVGRESLPSVNRKRQQIRPSVSPVMGFNFMDKKEQLLKCLSHSLLRDFFAGLVASTSAWSQADKRAISSYQVADEMLKVSKTPELIDLLHNLDKP